MRIDDVHTVTVRVYGDLVFFAPEAGRGVDVPFGAPRSVKDLLESLGIPHPEIGLILVEDEPVAFTRSVTAGDRVAAYPPFTSLDVDSPLPQPPPNPRFVLDVHLGTLARRLRLLGLDCDYATDRDDAELARIASTERRVLLSRDRELLMRSEVTHGYCPRSDDPDQQMLEVARRFLSAEDLAPLTRCARCNGILVPVAKADVSDEIGSHTRMTQEAFMRCSGCRQVYWPGSHTADLQGMIDTVRAACA